MRLLLAGLMGLGVDESYAVASARQLSLSYFDHPPLSFWLAHAAAAAFRSEAHLAVRLPFIALFAVTTWLIYRQTAVAFGERAGWLAALYLNVSLVFGVSTASWVLPDGPLMCALAAASLCLVHAMLDRRVAARLAWRWWIAAGVCSGLALLSKYQAVLFLAGVLLFLLMSRTHRAWLRRPEPYAAAAIALLFFAPVVVWNAQHGWASFAFQLGRGASPPHVALVRRLGALGQNLGGQATWVLPWLWVPLLWAMVQAFRRRASDDRGLYFATLAVVPITLFTAVALGGQPGLPHWPASGYLFLFPLLGAAAARLARRVADGARLPPATSPLAPAAGQRALRLAVGWTAWCVGAFVVILVAAGSAAITGWPARVFPAAFRRGDPTLEAADWRDLRGGLDSLGLLRRPHTFVAATSWIQAGKVAYALGPAVPVLCLSADPRHFGYLHDQREVLGEDAVIVDRLPSRHAVAAMYATNFASVAPAGRVTIRRLGRPLFDVAVYLGHDFRAVVPSRVRTLTESAVPAALRGDYLPPDPTQDLPRVERAP